MKYAKLNIGHFTKKKKQETCHSSNYNLLDVIKKFDNDVYVSFELDKISGYRPPLMEKTTNKKFMT